jgi:hypothetical protein
MKKGKSVQYFLQTRDGWEALLYVIAGYRCKTAANGVFVIDVTRRRIEK